jgi:hypothetical protein
VILLKLTVQPKIIPSPLPRLALATAALLAWSIGMAASSTQPQPERSGIGVPDAPLSEPASEILGGLDGWREAPGYVRLFAPEVLQSQYRAFVSARPLAAAVAHIRASVADQPVGAWEVEDLGPLDAFGLSGRYTRYLLSRLYTAGPVHVARGPHTSAQGYETWTLVSPYPDPALSRLSPGTLLLVTRVPPL